MYAKTNFVFSYLIKRKKIFCTIRFLYHFDKEVLNSHSSDIVHPNVGVKLTKTQRLIYELIPMKPDITYKEIASKINKSEEKVRRNLKILVNKKLIKRMGSDKAGFCKIKNKN